MNEISDYFAQVNQLLAQALAAQTQQAQLAQLGMVSSPPGVTLQNIASQPISIAPAVNTGKTGFISYVKKCPEQFRHTCGSFTLPEDRLGTDSDSDSCPTQK